MSQLSASTLQQVSEHLGRCVYVLVDPRDGVPFYVGKGRGVRMAAHGVEAQAVDADPGAVATPQQARINAIRAAGHEPQTWVLRYGLGEEHTAVEAAAIDLLVSFPVLAGSARAPLLGHTALTNQRRESAKGAGLVSLDDLVAEFAAPPLQHQRVPLLLVTLKPWADSVEATPGGGSRPGHGFRGEWLDPEHRARDIDALGDSVRCWWVLGEKRVVREGYHHAVAVFRGVTRGLFEIVPGSWAATAPDAKGRRRKGFQVTPIVQGPLFDQVVGPYGHRCPPKARGDQSTVNYWAGVVDTTDPAGL